MDVLLVSPLVEMCRGDFEKQNKQQFNWHWPLPLASLAYIDIKVKSEATNKIEDLQTTTTTKNLAIHVLCQNDL